MSNNTAPDSWESQADSNSAASSPSKSAADVTAAKFSTLNVNAVEFVPSFSFAKTSVGDAEEGSPTKSEESEETQEPVLNGRRKFF